jgi:hypothetical protein
MRLFLSYARRDRPKADLLAQRLRQLHHEAWLDTNLTGGQAWWDEILQQIRDCDALLLLTSSAYIKSEACSAERRYAIQLRKSLVPVAVERLRPEILPTDVSSLQMVDYSTPGEDSAIQLAVALSGLQPAGDLPDPLPSPPTVPVSYLSELSHRIGLESLSIDDQLILVSRLENSLSTVDDPEDKATVVDLLHKLSQRPDLYAETDRRIQRAFSQSQRSESRMSDSDPPPSQPPSISMPSAPTDQAPKQWSAEQVIKSPQGWRVVLRLSNEDHLIEYRSPGWSHRIFVDGQQVLKSGAFITNAEVQISDGETMRTLKLSGSRTWRGASRYYFFVDGKSVEIAGAD